VSRYFMGITLFLGDHNSARLEFKYGTTTNTLRARKATQGHFIVYDDVRLYGLGIGGCGFVGVLRYPKSRINESRRIPKDR
jgi:hypothetical protein